MVAGTQNILDTIVCLETHISWMKLVNFHADRLKVLYHCSFDLDASGSHNIVFSFKVLAVSTREFVLNR